MSISSDYTDIDLDKTYHLLAPVEVLLKREAILQSIEIFARFQTSSTSEVKEIRDSFHYEPLPLPSPSLPNEALYQFAKDRLDRPPQNDEEALMTIEALREKRDPKGIFQLPFESKEVQDGITKFRELLKIKKISQYFEIKNAYISTMKEINKIPGEKQLTYLEIKVVYVDPNNRPFNLALQLKPQYETF